MHTRVISLEVSNVETSGHLNT